jgi:hypothetical protein
MATPSSRRTAIVAISVLAAAAALSGCSKTSTVSAANAPTVTAAPVVQKTCAEHMAGADAARQTEVGDAASAMGLPSLAPDLNTKVDAACQANPDSSLSSVVRGVACSKAPAAAPTTAAPPVSAPGAPRVDARPTGLAVGHPARAGGGHGGGRSSGGSSGGSKSGGSSSGGSSSGGSSSGGSSSSGRSSSGGSSSSGSSSSGSSSGGSTSSGSSNPCS